jgi:hypothetical protein
MDKQILYYIVLVLGAITTRADLMRLTAGAGQQFVASNRFKYFLGLIAGIAFTSIVIWGFFNFEWYIALFSFIAISLGFGAVVTRNTVAQFVMLKPILEVITIALATLIWIL